MTVERARGGSGFPCSIHRRVASLPGPGRASAKEVPMRVLLIDNYDSFTYNLFQYLSELGASVEVRRNDAIGVTEAAALHPDRIVVSPGPCTPAEAGISIALIRELSPRIPTLGVCLGHQAIGAAFGGAVVRAPG